MPYELTLFACLFLALWSAVIGGVFSAFSEFIMAGLLRAKPAGGIEAMQQINKTVIKTQFVAGILLIGPLAIAMAVYALSAIQGIAQILLILAPTIFIPSVLLMTMFGNVPMNNKLDSLDPASPASESYWAHYGRNWTRLNHVRTIGSVVTAALYMIAAAVMMATSGAV